LSTKCGCKSNVSSTLTTFPAGTSIVHVQSYPSWEFALPQSGGYISPLLPKRASPHSVHKQKIVFVCAPHNDGIFLSFCYFYEDPLLNCGIFRIQFNFKLNTNAFILTCRYLIKIMWLTSLRETHDLCQHNRWFLHNCTCVRAFVRSCVRSFVRACVRACVCVFDL